MNTEESNDAEKLIAADSDENGAESAGENEDSTYGNSQLMLPPQFDSFARLILESFLEKIKPSSMLACLY